MSEIRETTGVLRRDTVRMVPHAAMIDCGGPVAGKATGTLAVVPLLDGDHVRGFEIRCGCGAAAVVECVYAPAAAPAAATMESPA